MSTLRNPTSGAWELGEAAAVQVDTTTRNVPISATMQQMPHVVLHNNSDNYVHYIWAATATGNPAVFSASLTTTADVAASPCVPPNSFVRVKRPTTGTNLRAKTNTGTADLAVIACRDLGVA